MYNNQASTYEELLECVGQCSLNDMRIQDHLPLTFKVIRCFNLPGNPRDMIRLRSSVKDLRRSYRLEISRVNTRAYGLHSFRYSAAN